MKNKFYYKKIFLYASDQFCGNIEEYFSLHTRKLVVFIVMPRVKNSGNWIREYRDGKLISKVPVELSENVILYYLKAIYFHWHILFSYFSKDEKFILIAGHPLCFFGLGIQKLARRVKYVYWVGDYFPGADLIISTYEKIKKRYHDSIPYSLYLSDGINMVFNGGRVVNTKNRKTVMWGVKSFNVKRLIPKRKFRLLFVGVIKESQGLEDVFKLLSEKKNMQMDIIGVCSTVLYKKYRKIIADYKLKERVWFPNKFIDEETLKKKSIKSHLGIALYDMSISNPTFYTDPGKIKAYTQFGLPVVMTDTSGIAPYVKKFKSGVVIKSIADLPTAISLIQENYSKYKDGVDKFNKYFEFERYYKKKFLFLE